MAVEVERKFLVLGEQWRELVVSSQDLQQGYLAASATCLVRVRAADDAGWLTIKGATPVPGEGQALVRSEYEWSIPAEEARSLLGELTLSRVAKTRHFLSCGPGEWTVDEFVADNAGLVLLEIEGQQAAGLAQAQLPDWVGEDVSADGRYSNAYLSQHPYRTWQ